MKLIIATDIYLETNEDFMNETEMSEILDVFKACTVHYDISKGSIKVQAQKITLSNEIDMNNIMSILYHNSASELNFHYSPAGVGCGVTLYVTRERD